jgi:hypothetical protein
VLGRSLGEEAARLCVPGRTAACAGEITMMGRRLGTRAGRAGSVLLLTAALGCGDDMSAAKSDDAGGAGTTTDAGAESAQRPPTERAALEAWLADGAYRDWHCEPDVHASRSPSPHGFNRICSNDLVADNIAGSAPWPEGAAAVKELYASADAAKPMGYAVYLKTAADSADGAAWYWYEKMGGDVVADGLGDSGGAKSICVGCHVAAGADAAHTPTEHGRDQVYTPVE